MPLTLDQRQRIVQAHGKNPGEWDYDENTGELVSTFGQQGSPPTVPETTTALLQKPEVKQAPSLGESVVRSATESFLPTAASLGTMALGAAAFPEPASPVLAGIGLLLAGAGAGIGTSALQRKVLPKDVQSALFTTPESQQAHPLGSALGGFIPSALAFNPVKGIQDLPTLARGVGKLPAVLGPIGRSALTAPEEQAIINAAMNTVPQAGMNLYQQATSPEPFSTQQFLSETLPGLLFTRPTRLGKAMGFHEPISPEALAAAYPKQPEIPTTTREISPVDVQETFAPYERVFKAQKNPMSRRVPLEKMEKAPFPEGIFLREEPRLMEEAKARMEGEGGPPAPEPKEPIPPVHPETQKMIEEVQKQIDDLKREQQSRQSEEGDLKAAVQTEVDKLSPDQQVKLNRHLRDLARRRGFRVTEVPEILTPEGKSIAGDIDLAKRAIRLSTAKGTIETPAHEGAGHGFLNDLLTSRSKGDQQLGVKALNAYAGKERFKSPEDWYRFVETNPEEAYRAKTSIEETLARDIALEGTRQSQVSLYGSRKERLKQWLSGAKSRWKTEFGLSSPEDIRTHLIQRYRGDAPYGTRLEFAPMGAGKVGETNAEEEKGKEILKEGQVRESAGEEEGLSYRRDPEAVAKMGAKEFGEKMSGFTKDAIAYGESIKGQPEKIARLRQLSEEATTEFRTAMEEKRYDDAMALSSKPQYFNEAIQGAEGAEQVQKYKRLSQEGELPKISEKEYRTTWNNWEDHAALIGKTIRPNFSPDEQIRIGKSAIEAIAKKDSLGDKIINLLAEKGVIHATQMEDFRKKVIALQNNLREYNGMKRLSEEGEIPFERPTTLKELEEGKRNKVAGFTPEMAVNEQHFYRTTPETVKTGKAIEEKLGEASFKAAKEVEARQKVPKQAVNEDVSAIADDIYKEYKRKGDTNLPFGNFGELARDLIGYDGIEKQDSARAFLKKETGEEFLQELEEKIHRLNLRTGERLFENERNLRESATKASFKAQEAEAFTRPDVERQSEEGELAYKEDASKYPTSYSFNRLLTARLDRVGEKINTPTAHEVTYKLRQANTERDILEGRVGNRLIAATQGYSPEEIARVYEYRHAIDNDFPAPYSLSSHEEELKTALDKTYKEIGQMVIDSGLKVRAGESFREMKLRDTGYQQNTLSSKVANAWAESLPEGKDYDRLFIEHAVKKGESLDSAKNLLDEYKQAIGNAGITPDVRFGAIRKVEGIGLPWELVEPNFNVAARRYGRRVAGDLGFFKYIQNDPRMQKALGIKDQFGHNPKNTPELEGVDYIGSSPEVKAAMRSLYGIDIQPNPMAQSLARVVGANIMQTGTAIRNILQLPTSIAPYYGVNPRTVMSAIEKMNSRAARAFENNAIKASYKDFDAAGEFEGNPNKFIAMADKYVTFMRKWTGRDLSDRLEGLFSYSLGEELATRWFAQAKDGDIKARAMLNRFGTTVEGGVKEKWKTRSAEITPDDIARVAKEFVDVVRGSYSAGGLPSAAIEGPMAPILSLSRWSVERANNFYKDAILPIKESGDWMPLLKTAFTSLLSGAAIEQLNELLGGKRGSEPTTKEVLLGGSKEDILPKAIGLAQLGSLGGIMSDTLKFGSNLVRGKETKFSSPISYPLASITEDLAQKIAFASSAIHEGEDPFAVLGEFMKEVLRAQSQNGRYVMNHMGEEAARKEKFRDLRIFKELQGAPLADLSQANPFLNLAGKEFKREEDIGKAVTEDLPRAIKQIVTNANGDYEKLRKGLAGLKANSYQTFPSLNSPKEASDYYKYLVDTQGKEEADKRISDFLLMTQKNQVKSSFVSAL